ncbi:hypothetical protein [Rhodopirellula bahusiensis]|uniref:hypothetical protein n=1 Tax=Rhodopirellula bahusiensis TaxID=2014065 RepID=UPI00326485DD
MIACHFRQFKNGHAKIKLGYGIPAASVETNPAETSSEDASATTNPHIAPPFDELQHDFSADFDVHVGMYHTPGCRGARAVQATSGNLAPSKS